MCFSCICFASRPICIMKSNVSSHKSKASIRSKAICNKENESFCRRLGVFFGHPYSRNAFIDGRSKVDVKDTEEVAHMKHKARQKQHISFHLTRLSSSLASPPVLQSSMRI
mmetsp:Transcript_5672/g.9730  ORF Transcript_5672/g.9730 Transcript_5672/m.9730 type:complete len:111 (+) Transcript_5672:2910-3242(+)